MSIQFHGKTHVGRRSLNEDRFIADAGWGVALISDGMGGHEAGEVAANIVCAGMLDLLDQDIALPVAAVQAHEAVQQAATNGQGKPGMGATLVVACFDGHDFELAWIGDSRAYLWHDELHQITRDHSQVELALAKGEISVEAARHAPNRHMITRAMGLGELTQDEVPILRGTLARGQSLLLCSDGLSDVVSGVDIATVMSRELKPEDKLDELIQRAVSAGGKDNITAIIVTAGDDAPATDNIVPPPPVSIARADGYTAYFAPDEAQ